MRQDKKRALTYSGSLHLLVIVLLIAGLPSLFTPDREFEPSVITVEILPITGVTNVKPSRPKPVKKEVEEKKEEPKKPTPPVVTKKEEPAPPPPPKEEPKEKEKPVEKVEKKPEEKKKEKPKPTEDDLLAVLKSVKENANKSEAKPDKKAEDSSDSEDDNKARSDKYDPSLPMSLSEKDAIRSQISKNWVPSPGAKDAHELIIVLRIQLQKDGTLIDVKVANQSKSRYDSDSFFRAAADSAIRAVRLSDPIQQLPPDKYDTWRDIELTFDPSEMLF